jgi:hypothetical protein
MTFHDFSWWPRKAIVNKNLPAVHMLECNFCMYFKDWSDLNNGQQVSTIWMMTTLPLKACGLIIRFVLSCWSFICSFIHDRANYVYYFSLTFGFKAFKSIYFRFRINMSKVKSSVFLKSNFRPFWKSHNFFNFGSNPSCPSFNKKSSDVHHPAFFRIKSGVLNWPVLGLWNI